jgi:hypothetical protein
MPSPQGIVAGALDGGGGDRHQAEGDAKGSAAPEGAGQLGATGDV